MSTQLSQIEEMIIEHIEQRLGRAVDGPVNVTSSLVQDLHLDSLESVNLLAELEDHFEVTMPIQLFQRANTVGDVAQAVVGVLAGQPRAAG